MSDRAERLSDLVVSRVRELASYDVYAQKTTYRTFVKIYIPHAPIKKLLPGMEVKIKPLLKNTGIENDLERSIRRAQKTIRDYCLYNDFDLFSTFTFKSDRQNVEGCKTKMQNWVKNQKRRTSKFEHLIIPEFHKDGESIHFHALFNGYDGGLTDSGIIYNGRKVYNFKSYTLGHTVAVKIDNPEKVSSYIRKYITKDTPQLFGKNRYWPSLGLKLPPTEDNPKDLLSFKNPTRTYVKDYGVYYFYPIEPQEKLNDS
jgi:hypothetical protein